VGRYVFLPGDPDRVPKIARLWNSAREVSMHREYRVWSGLVGEELVSACSTGIGGPATAIALEELAAIGGDTFVRIGSCGTLKREIKPGDLVIATGAVRLDGTSKQYVQSEYPAVPSYDVTLALIEAAEKLGFTYHVGYTASSDSFYVGQGRPGFHNYLPKDTEKLVSFLGSVNVLTFEMEASTIFTLAGIYGLRAGCICAVYANRITDEFRIAGEEEACRTAVEAVRILSKWDRDRERSGRRYWCPSLSF
jgi:uridine phosphorylase